jgi:DNA-binding HxlR family transcriptional regulator
MSRNYCTVIEALREHGPCTVYELVEHLPSMHVAAIRRTLNRGVQDGRVRRVGSRPALNVRGEPTGGPRQVVWAPKEDGDA